MSAIVDLATVRGFAKDYGADFAQELVGALKESVQECVPLLQAGADANDGDAVASAAHKLKSGCRNLGAARVGDLCEQLEYQGKAGAMVDARQQVVDIATHCTLFLTACDEWLTVNVS